MARKKKKLKIEVTVPEPIDRLRMPKSSDAEKLKAAIKETDVKTALKTDEIKRFVKQNDKLLLASVIVVVAIVSVSLLLVNYYLSNEPPEVYVPTKVTRTETITVTVPANLSFDEYLENSLEYEDELVTVIGIIKSGIKWGEGTSGELGT